MPVNTNKHTDQLIAAHPGVKLTKSEPLNWQTGQGILHCCTIYAYLAKLYQIYDELG